MHTIKWKRENSSGQTMSQCGRYWFVWLDYDDPGKFFECFRLWHDDTRTLVGHRDTVTEAKAAAQEHYENMRNMRRDMALTNRNPV